jgi:hypothetical protein
MKLDAMKRLEEELEVINKTSLKGKTIEAAKLLSDLQSTNSREILFNTMKELYKWTKKTLKVLDSIPTEAPVSGPTSDDIKSMIKQELTDTLPGLLQEALKDTLSSLSPVQAHPEPTQEEKPLPDMHTLTVQNKPEGEEETENPISQDNWVKVVKKDLKSSLKYIPVQRVSLSSGKATLRFSSKDDLAKAEEALKSSYKVTPKSQEQKKLDPKLTISNLDPEITKAAQLLDELLDENKYIKDLVDGSEQMRVVFLDEKKHFAVLQVSTEIRGAIRRNNDRVQLGLQSHPLRDRIHAVQCYHCQEFGHTSKSNTYCKSKGSDATCCFCAGNHESKNCQNKKDNKTNKIKCANCAKSKSYTERSSATTHKASDSLCPFYVRETEMMMARTKGCTEQTKNLYRQRVQDLRTRLGRR